MKLFEKVKECRKKNVKLFDTVLYSALAVLFVASILIAVFAGGELTQGTETAETLKTIRETAEVLTVGKF